MDLETPDRLARIRELNDSFRRTFVGGAIMLTAGVAELCEEVRAEVMNRVRMFNRFTDENNPHGENDFGSFEIGKSKLYFKIDYFDRAVQYGSPDPADPSKTTRIMTIGFLHEY